MSDMSDTDSDDSVVDSGSSGDSSDSDKDSDKYDTFISEFFRLIVRGTDRVVHSFAYQAVRANSKFFGIVFECFNSCVQSDSYVVRTFFETINVSFIKAFMDNMFRFAPDVAWRSASYLYDICCMAQKKNTVEEYYADRLINAAIKDLKKKGVVLVKRPYPKMEETNAFDAIDDGLRAALTKKFEERNLKDYKS